MTNTPVDLAELLSAAFEQPVHIDPTDFLEKVLAGLFGRQPDMSGDARKRLMTRELHAVQDTAAAIIRTLEEATRLRGDAGREDREVEHLLREAEDRLAMDYSIGSMRDTIRALRDKLIAALTPPAPSASVDNDWSLVSPVEPMVHYHVWHTLWSSVFVGYFDPATNWWQLKNIKTGEWFGAGVFPALCSKRTKGLWFVNPTPQRSRNEAGSGHETITEALRTWSGGADRASPVPGLGYLQVRRLPARACRRAG